MKVIKRGLLIVLGVGLLAYLGGCVWANFFAGDGAVKLPDINKAHYAVTIRSTGQVLFSDKVADKGQTVTLTGYYEYTGKRFVYRKAPLTLDESLFGQVSVVKRQVPK